MKEASRERSFYIITNEQLNVVLWGGFFPESIFRLFRQFAPIKSILPELPYERIIDTINQQTSFEDTFQYHEYNLQLHFTVQSLNIDTEVFYFFNFSNDPKQIINQQFCFNTILQFVLKGREAEKAYITRELHDGLGQLITALKIKLSIFERYHKVRPIDTDLTSINNLVDLIQKEIRSILLQLNASCLEISLIDSLTILAQQLQTDYPEVRIDYQVALSKDCVFEKNIELNIYRIIQEALNNCFKHSKANLIKLYLGNSDQKLIVFVDDDGIGFDKEKAQIGYGLKNMESRAKLLRAELHIETDKKGTSVLLSVPL